MGGCGEGRQPGRAVDSESCVPQLAVLLHVDLCVQ